jgi:hypothetical protein
MAEATASVSAVGRFNNPLTALFDHGISCSTQSAPELASAPAPPEHSLQRLFPMPAAGYRHESSGGLANVGTWGLYHASSSYAAGSINSAYLNLNADNVNPLNNANRASALSVRCVQHLRGLFFYPFPIVIRHTPVRNGGDQGPGQRGRVDSAIRWRYRVSCACQSAPKRPERSCGAPNPAIA